MGLAKSVAKRFLSLTKGMFYKVDPFKEAIEDELSQVSQKASDFKSLDEFKATLIQTGFTVALSMCTGGTAGAVAGVLTADRIKLVSELIVSYGHKAEHAFAVQLAKK